MIRFYPHKEIDSEKWNHCVKSSSSATVFADYDLLNLVAPGWCALIQDDYKAVMPLPSRLKWGISYIYTPFFVSRLGIFASPSPSAETTRDFVLALPPQYKQCDLCLNNDNDPTLLPADSYQMMVSHSLNLNCSYETLSAAFAENMRRNIKTAQKKGLSITAAEIGNIVDLFRKNRGADSQIHFNDTDYEMLISMVDFWKQRNLIELVGVKDEKGKLIAGACFLRDGHRLWFLFSGRDNAESDKRAMFYLLNEYIKKHSGKELMLDFNGSLNPDIARFYAGFGSQRYEFPVLAYTPPSFFAPIVKRYRHRRS